METIRFGKRAVPTDRALVMAIVNRTRDSFYDRGATYDDRPAMAAVDRLVAEGADIVDIGGVRAGSHGEEVDVAEEIRRVVPFVAAVRERHPDLVISVDTWRHQVARAACLAGADLINDTWAGADPAVAEVAAELTDRAERMVAAGVPRSGVLIDPTHDFGKNTWHGLELLRRLDELVATGWPVLMALSNKDFVGETLGADLTERLDGTLAATSVAAFSGAKVFRAHEVRQTRRVVEMVASIAGTRPPALCLRALA